MKETLAEYISRIVFEKRLNGYEVERNTQGEITQSYFNRLKNGTAKNPSALKVKTLAKGLGVPEGEIFNVIRGVDAHDSEISHERLVSIDFAYKSLSEAKKKKADYLIELLDRETQRLKTES